MKRICVVGAGTAGLCSAKWALHNNFEVVVFEQTAKVGGTWVYTSKTGKDQYGIDIHTSMYEGLRTNLPKEIMGFPDFPIKGYEESYVPAKGVENFLEDYAQFFKLNEHIRFLHHVLRISPKTKGWQVIVKDLKQDRTSVHFFDYVLVCNGHYHTPLYPTIQGSDTFEGLQLHSHDYRNVERFRGETVLVIGAGPSGMDLCNEISKVAVRVTLSHHLPEKPKTVFAPNVTQRPDVRQIDENGVYFTDGSYETFSVILYCTGYKYAFPFLSTDCGIFVEDNCVQPLYKHCINIRYPTMAFIGIPFYVCAAQMVDLQVRFVMKYFLNEKSLPSAEEMYAEMEQEMAERQQKGYKKRQFHMMGEDQAQYYNDLAESAGIEKIKPVMAKLHNESSKCFVDDLLNFRNDVFRIIDDETFIRI